MKLDRLENKNIIWSLDFCPECDRIKKILKDKGVIVEDRAISELMDGDICYPSAIRQLIKQNYVAPIVCLNGGIINYKEL